MKTLKNLFREILTGDREASRLAAREVRKVMFSSHSKDKTKDIRSIISSAPVVYEKIKEDWRQENFAMSVSIIYFMRDETKSLELLYCWIFELLQHKNGYIRYAAFRMIRNDLGPLTVHIRHPNSIFKHTYTPEVSNNILLNLYVNLNNFSVQLNKPSYDKYKYVDQLPASPYKTVEMALEELEYLCGKVYMKNLERLIIE